MIRHKISFKSLLFTCVTMLAVSAANAQGSISVGEKPKDDTVKAVPRMAIRPYNKVITKDFTTQKGLFAVHQSNGKIYFEIPDSILKQDIMVINRLTKVPARHEMYAGELLDQSTIYFEKGKDSSIKIRFDLIMSEAKPESEIFKAVSRASNNPIIGSFPILAHGKNSEVIDVSTYLKGKNFINNIDANTAFAKNITSIFRDVNIESIRTYPINIEITISKTAESKIKALEAGTPATFETNTSFIALPKVPMQRRYYDPRVGFFADALYEFADDQQKTEIRRFICRWRMEPKPQDMAKWKKGEIVEPAKPIVIYIDPATPKQWRPYLIAGINDWQKAFEQAGFKNAITGKEWPENDTTMHMEDARYSFVNYLPSETENAYGPNVHDPRSGEIIQTHIGWYHNVMDLLHSWYMIQAGAVDPEARKPKFDDKLMGQLIRFVSSHEVGHTLGLCHNFGSSSRTPVESLRDKKYLEEHGHTASIMDYARFDYVAQPEDNIPQNLLFPRIGEYDKWAIEWGYKYLNARDADADKKIVNSWIDKRIKENSRLWFGDGETRKFDPRCQAEDLGDNAMKASAYGIKNLQRILPNLPEWTYEPDKFNQGLGGMYAQVKNQYTRYITHVMKNIAGITVDIRNEADGGIDLEVVPREKQLEALDFVNKQLFTTPYWLLDKKILSKVNIPDGPDVVQGLQAQAISVLLFPQVLVKMMANQMQYGKDALSVDELIKTLHGYIWSSLDGSNKIQLDVYQRNMQKSYVEALRKLLTEKDWQYTQSDAASLVKAEITSLQKQVDAAQTRGGDDLTTYHLADLKNRIKAVLNPLAPSVGIGE